nr:DUF2188 domain-containing protein [Kitasatospora sp. Xyl93]
MAGKPKSGDITQRADGRWQFTRPENSRASAVADTQAAAVARGREILGRDGGGELRIHGTNGVIRDQRTIAPGNDPYPPKG